MPALRTDVISWSSKELMSINLRDYDGIIFDMSEYYSSPYDDSSMRDIFEDHSISPAIIYDVLKKPETFIIIVGDPNTRVSFKSIIDLVGFSVSSEVRYGDTVIREKAPDHTFNKYLDRIKEYNYFLHDEIDISKETQKEWRANIAGYKMRGNLVPLLKNRADKILAAKLEPFSKLPPAIYGYDENDHSVMEFGDIYLLPSIDEMNKNDMISEILDLYFGEEKPEPEWTKSIKIQGQDDIENDLKGIGDEIDKLTKQKGALIKQLDDLRQPIEILWKSDKALEKSVKKVLKSMGATIHSGEEENSENAADCSFTYEKMNFAVEIKSTSKQMIDKKGLRQVRDWVEDLSDAGKEYKGLLIASNEIDKEPKDRNPEFLPDNLVDYAKAQGIAVISIKTLFDAYLSIKNNTNSAKVFFKNIFNQNGIYNTTKTNSKSEPS